MLSGFVFTIIILLYVLLVRHDVYLPFNWNNLHTTNMLSPQTCTNCTYIRVLIIVNFLFQSRRLFILLFNVITLNAKQNMLFYDGQG